MSSRVQTVFASLAENLRVPEEDFLTLVREGIATADELYFRLRTSGDINSFLEDVVWPNVSYKGHDGTITRTPRPSGDEGPVKVDWMRGPAAASLRRLWEASKQVAKRDLETLTDESSTTVPLKMSAAVVADMQTKFVEKGLPSFTDFEYPGRKCLGKLSENFRTGGPWSHISWESYTSQEDENRAIRAKGPKHGQLAIVTKNDGSLAGLQEEDCPRKPRVDELMTLQDVFQTRAIAFEFLSLIRFDLYSQLHSLYIRKVRTHQPERMRPPTLGEVRLCDRLLHEDIYRHYRS